MLGCVVGLQGSSGSGLAGRGSGQGRAQGDKARGKRCRARGVLLPALNARTHMDAGENGGMKKGAGAPPALK